MADYYDILIIGSVGKGKSTTGNKILESHAKRVKLKPWLPPPKYMAAADEN